MTEQPIGQLERDGDAYAVLMVREYEVPIARVWDALTEPTLLLEWLGSVEIEAHVGGSFLIDFDGEDHAGGAILCFEPPQLLEFEWGETGVQSRVRFELSETGSGTRLRLTHARQTESSARNTGPGWHAHLDVFEGALLGSEVKWEDAYAAARPRYEVNG